jgi:class 3 adenylate cyclase
VSAPAGWLARARQFVLGDPDLPGPIRHLLDAQVRRGAEIAHLVRLVLALAGMAGVVANWASNSSAAAWLGAGTAAAYAAYSGVTWSLLRRGHYAPWLPYLSVTMDCTGVTALSLTGLANYSGGYEVLLAPIWLLFYFMFNALSMLTYSVGASLYAGLLSAAQRGAVLAYVLGEDLVRVSATAVYGERAVAISDQLTILFFIALSGIIPAWRTRANRDLLVQAAGATVAAAEDRRKTESLRKYVSDNVVEWALGNPEAMGLGGVRRHASVMFVDIRDFTPFTERESPERVVEFLNTFLGAAVDRVFAHGGTLEKFTGDGLMALFGVPQPMADPPFEALTAATEIREWVRAFNAAKPADQPPLRIGIGIAHGLVVAGNIGSPRRMEYSVVGDTANFASRLQELNKDMGTEVLVSASVAEAVTGKFDLRAMPPLKVRGKREPAVVYALAAVEAR